MNYVEPAKHHALRVFVLDLLYPAVLGALIVFLFIRLAKSGFSGLTDPTTHFGIILVVFYAFGFLAAKLSSNYSPSMGLVDCFSSALMFVCFYILGLSEEATSHDTPYGYFYLAMVIVVLSPMVRRAIEGHRPHFRNVLGFLSAAVVLLALGSRFFTQLAWLSPGVLAGILYFLLLVYFIHIGMKGVVAR